MAASAARPRTLPGALSGPRRPLSPGECPRRPLTPAGRLHPAISGPPRPWSWDTWGRGASNWPTWLQTRRPLRPVPTTAKIPLSSIRKGVPLYGWKNRGEAPRRWLLSEPRLVSFRPRRGAAHAREGPQPQAALRATGPTLGKACPVNRVPGVLSGEREALRATQKTASFPVEHTSRQLSHPRKAECPEKTGAPGAGKGGRQGFAPGGASPIERNPRPPTGSAGGLRPEPCLGS